MVVTLSRNLVSVTLESSAEHITAYAHRMGGEYVDSQVEGDRAILTFAFDDYFNAVNFQTSLGSVRGFIAAAIAKS